MRLQSLMLLKKTKNFFAVSIILVILLCFYSDKIWAQIESLYNSTTDQFAGISNLMSATASNDIDGVRFFSKAGSLVINQRNKGGATALHIACRESNLEIAKILIDNGANVNIQDNEGWTPLMRASIANNSDLVEYLLLKGAKANLLNSQNESALVHSAISRCTQCINHIIEKGNLIKNMNTLILKNQVADAFLIARNQENKQNQGVLESFLDYISKISPLIASDQNMNTEALDVIGGNINIQDSKINKFGKNFVLKNAENQSLNDKNDNIYSVLEDPNLPSISTFKDSNLSDAQNSPLPTVSLNENKDLKKYKFVNNDTSNNPNQQKVSSPNISYPISDLSIQNKEKTYKFKALEKNLKKTLTDESLNQSRSKSYKFKNLQADNSKNIATINSIPQHKILNIDVSDTKSNDSSSKSDQTIILIDKNNHNLDSIKPNYNNDKSKGILSKISNFFKKESVSENIDPDPIYDSQKNTSQDQSFDEKLSVAKNIDDSQLDDSQLIDESKNQSLGVSKPESISQGKKFKFIKKYSQKNTSQDLAKSLDEKSSVDKNIDDSQLTNENKIQSSEVSEPQSATNGKKFKFIKK